MQCHRILHEHTLEPPLKTEITAAEIAERVAGIEHLLHALLPSRPCLVTIARSNQGAFTPLRWTMSMEDAIVEMLERLYGRQPTGVQYLRSAFGSHEASVSTFDRIERERPREGCQAWCSEPCEQLNGDTERECHACTSPMQCRPGEPWYGRRVPDEL